MLIFFQKFLRKNFWKREKHENAHGRFGVDGKRGKDESREFAVSKLRGPWARIRDSLLVEET
jgi:hypothetical protein